MVPFHIAAGAINTRPTNILFNWITPFLLVFAAMKLTTTVSKSEEA
jgi:hypothetical protein